MKFFLQPDAPHPSFLEHEIEPLHSMLSVDYIGGWTDLSWSGRIDNIERGYLIVNVLIVVLYKSNITIVAQQNSPRARPSTRGLSQERQATAFDKEKMKDNKNDSQCLRVLPLGPLHICSLRFW